MHNKAGWRGSSPSASLAVHGFELLLEGISEQLVSVTSRESVSSYWRFFWGRSRALALTARHSGPLQAASTPPAFRASATPVPRARLRLGRSMRGVFQRAPRGQAPGEWRHGEGRGVPSVSANKTELVQCARGTERARQTARI
jgi:hypothetical protein